MLSRFSNSITPATTLAATAGVGGALWLWQRRRRLAAAAEVTKQAAVAMRQQLLDAYAEAGFERRHVHLASGEEVPYLVRAKAMPPRRVLVFLHGMTADAVLSAAAVLPLAKHAPPLGVTRERLAIRPRCVTKITLTARPL